MKELLQNEIWTIGMFVTLVLIGICCSFYGTEVDYQAIDLSVAILGVNLILKLLPVIWTAIDKTIPNDRF